MSWKDREAARFGCGEYRRLPWDAEFWYANSVLAQGHFAHVCKKDPTKVAFTENDQKGEADRQTVIRPGRYLAKFFKDKLTAETISRLAATFNPESEKLELSLAETPKDCAEVYANGPGSCMSGCADSFESFPHHPAEVYGEGDLAVAYLKRGDRITARAVVWPEKKIRSVIYGDDTRLGPLLDAAGYENGSVNGARVLKILHDSGSYVMPYVDGANDAGESSCGKFLILGDGYHSVCSTHGLTEPSGYMCENCEDRYGEDEIYSLDGGNVHWCSYCLEANGFTCSDCCESYSGHDYILADNGRTLCDGCRDEYSPCVECDDWFHEERIIITREGDSVCEGCVDDNYRAEECGEYTAKADEPCDCGTCETARKEEEGQERLDL